MTDRLARTENRRRHLELLLPWPRFAERFWYPIPGRGDLGCFGSGFNHWGVQTNQKYLAAMAVLAMDDAADERAAGMSREQMLDRALSALRYELATHASGLLRRTDNSQWGHTWISGLGIERMMHAVDALDGRLGDEDRDALRRVLTSEADWLLRHYDVTGDPWAESGKNHPESNYWNGAILLRAAMMYADHADRHAWTEKGYRFLLNAINVPADAEDRRLVAGTPLAEWQVGANFFPHFALDHHSYLNVGYMVICLSNVAMLHYGYALRGIEAPEAVYHHARDLWQLVRRLVFGDGRLARIGGDSRQRYCYCQDYLLPVLVFAADVWHDDVAGHLEAGQLDLIAREQAANSDGSFLSRRLGHIEAMSPYYYTRLEADKAVCLSMAALWRRLRGMAPATRAASPEKIEASLAGGWEEPLHGAMMHRSPTRLASWSWRACELPQGLCLPPDDGTLAEWSECLAGRVSPLGEQRHPIDGRSRHRLVRTMQRSFDGGFVTCGTTTDGADVVMMEGYRATDLVEHHIAFAALPDGHTALRIELARNGPQRTYLADVRGLKLNLQNDLMNGGRRRVHTARGSHELTMTLDGAERTEALGSLWANIEDRIGVVAGYGSDGLAVYRPGRRTAGYTGSLYFDELCTVVRLGTFDVPAGAPLLDNGCAIIASVDAATTRSYADSGGLARAACDEADARALVAAGQDGGRYLLVANFAAHEAAVTVSSLGGDVASATDLADGATVNTDGASLKVTLGAGEARLLALNGR
ncbi:MAG: hypothetical protein GXY74_10065 [Phycisphaerae bacterium]|nr:hypothetical protein [Phycisphaerae bacterium]